MLQVIEPRQATPRKVDPLARSLEQFRQALQMDASGQERAWARTLGNTLAQVEQGLRRHQAGACEAHEILAHADEPRATLTRQVKRVSNDYDELLVQVVALREDVRQAARTAMLADDPDIKPGEVLERDTIRRSAEKLLAGLQQNRETETRLLQESINTDIGVGD